MHAVRVEIGFGVGVVDAELRRDDPAVASRLRQVVRSREIGGAETVRSRGNDALTAVVDEVPSVAVRLAGIAGIAESLVMRTCGARVRLAECEDGRYDEQPPDGRTNGSEHDALVAPARFNLEKFVRSID